MTNNIKKKRRKVSNQFINIVWHDGCTRDSMKKTRAARIEFFFGTILNISNDDHCFHAHCPQHLRLLQHYLPPPATCISL
jgi:hypothetical protein